MSAQVDWMLLRAFLAVARTTSFSEGARELGIHASTVSRQMASLEEELHTRLFQRLPRGVELTAAGELLSKQVRAMEVAAFAGVRAVAGRDVELEGAVRLTTTHELLWVILPALRDFQTTYPSVELVIDTGSTFRDLSRREADVALRASLRPPEDAIATPLGALQWAVYGHRDFLQAAGWVDVREAWGGAPEPPAGPRVSVSSVHAAIQAVRQGLGRGALPCFAADAQDGLVRMAELPDLARSSLWLLVHPDLRKVARVRALVDHLKRTVTPLVAPASAPR
ncbi:MAG: DNA-binding transcriptional LysR family regulator [Myxococcota bacterium]|jgi:DNA-binding transcriptional LysR family regulator